jgi:hypothetical protein
MVEQIAHQQTQQPQPQQLQQIYCQIDQQKEQGILYLEQFIQKKSQLLRQVQDRVLRQQIENSIQRLIQLVQLKQQIRQLLIESKHSCNQQKVRENCRQVIQLCQLSRLILNQIQDSSSAQMGSGFGAQGLFGQYGGNSGFQGQGWNQWGSQSWNQFSPQGLQGLHCPLRDQGFNPNQFRGQGFQGQFGNQCSSPSFFQGQNWAQCGSQSPIFGNCSPTFGFQGQGSQSCPIGPQAQNCSQFGSPHTFGSTFY